MMLKIQLHCSAGNVWLNLPRFRFTSAKVQLLPSQICGNLCGKLVNLQLSVLDPENFLSTCSCCRSWVTLWLGLLMFLTKVQLKLAQRKREEGERGRVTDKLCT